MTQTSRRDVLHAIGWGVALPALALPVRLAASEGRVSFPDSPITLTRELERSLGGGAAVTVARTWECRFNPMSGGATIDARQIEVSVEAPPALAALAKIERSREVTCLFPMELDMSGAIVGWADGDTDLQRAVEEAARAIDLKALEQSAETDAKRYVAEIGKKAAALVSQVPRDLFFPQTGERSELRTLDLPGGGKGSYEVTISATARASDGLLDKSERRIVTRVGGSERVSRETWSAS